MNAAIICLAILALTAQFHAYLVTCIVAYTFVNYAIRWLDTLRSINSK